MPGADLRGLPRAERDRIYRRRRIAAAAAAGGLLLLLLWAGGAFSGGGDADAEREALPQLPRGGRQILPGNRVVAYYGAPQDPKLGVLGAQPLARSARELERQARLYATPRRPALPALELIAVLAQADPGEDGLYRLRQSDAVIARHLAAARRMKALLILDIQPGHADFMDEVTALERWLAEPDVSLALDPEWKVPAGVAPGSEIGSTDADTVNDVSAYLAALVRQRQLPQKLLIMHQFTEDMVERREEIDSRPAVGVVNNVDGFGTAELKTGVYRRLADRDGFNGFKLFFEEDAGLMEPADVLALVPRPDIVVYE